MGLLQKAEQVRTNIPYEEDDSLSNTNNIYSAFSLFHNFAQETNIEKICFWVPCGNTFFMIFSHGIDEETVKRSTSPASFWEKNLFENTLENEWLTVTDSDLYEFRQFFSKNENENMLALHLKTIILPSNRKCVLCILESKLTQAYKYEHELDLQSVEFTVPTLVSSFDQELEVFSFALDNIFHADRNEYYNTIDSLLNSNLLACFFVVSTDRLQDFISTVYSSCDTYVIYLEIFSKIKEEFAKVGLCSASKSGDIRIALFSEWDEEAENIEEHLIESLNEILWFDSRSYISVLPAGTSRKANGILDFIKQDY